MNPLQSTKALDFYFDRADCLREERLPQALRLPVPVESGGSGAETLTDHGVLLGSGTDAITATAVGSTGQVLTGVTGADPSWQSPAAKFVDRGDPSSYDKVLANWTTDGTWRDWDLSSVVPAGAVAIVLRLSGYCNPTAQVAFRKNGNSNAINISACNFTVISVWFEFVVIVPCSTARVIEYNAGNVTWGALNSAVVGWLL